MELLNGKRRGLARQNFSKKNLGGPARLSFPKENLGGFTVIELLIVIGIVAVIGTVSLANLVGWRSAKELSSTSQKIATLIREAESRAMSQNRGAAWGVHFDAGDGTNPQPFFSLFYASKSGSLYNSANEVERYPLPSSIKYRNNDIEMTGLRDIVFDQITGKPRVSDIYDKSNLGGQPRTGSGRLQPIGGVVGPIYNYVTIDTELIKIRSEKQQENPSTIRIQPTGTIAFDSLSCIFTCYVQQVILLPSPIILSFTAAPTSTTPSQPATLSWMTVNADSCSGSPWTDSHEANGSAVVTPPQTATYSLRCSGGGQITPESSVTVEVITGIGDDSGGTEGGRPRIQR